jgi:hypothetical protein
VLISEEKNLPRKGGRNLSRCDLGGKYDKGKKKTRENLRDNGMVHGTQKFCRFVLFPFLPNTVSKIATSIDKVKN